MIDRRRLAAINKIEGKKPEKIQASTKFEPVPPIQVFSAQHQCAYSPYCSLFTLRADLENLCNHQEFL